MPNVSNYMRAWFALWMLITAPMTLGQSPSPNSSTTPRPVDGVRILEVLPSRLIVGKEQQVYVRVRYDLESLDKGLLVLCFNTHEGAEFRHYAQESVEKGRGEIVLNARVTPRDWGELVFFEAFVLLSGPLKKNSPSLAVDHVPISLIKGSLIESTVTSKTAERVARATPTAATPHASDPNGKMDRSVAAPSPARPLGRVDGVRIVEVLPSRLIVGKEQEVFVRVHYDLKSLDTGLIMLFFNTSEGAKFRDYAQEAVEKGKGEIVLSARVTPRDWSDVGLFQALVSLGAPRSRALAVDHIPLVLRKDP